MNAQLNVLWAAAPSIILPDTTYYTEDNEKGKELLGIWREMEEELLEKYGFTAEEIKDILDKVIALMLSWPSMSFRVKNLPSMWNSTTHMIGKTLPS